MKVLWRSYPEKGLKNAGEALEYLSQIGHKYQLHELDSAESCVLPVTFHTLFWKFALLRHYFNEKGRHGGCGGEWRPLAKIQTRIWVESHPLEGHTRESTIQESEYGVVSYNAAFPLHPTITRDRVWEQLHFMECSRLSARKSNSKKHLLYSLFRLK